MSTLNLTQEYWPERPACFGWPNSTRFPECSVPSPAAIAFLNITNFNTYFAMYCLNPPSDSCAFGYCPNPDIASPAVRTATYITQICFSILILFSPEDTTSVFYSQVVIMYSLLVAAVIDIFIGILTLLHAQFVILVALSPLAMYLLFCSVRGLGRNSNRLVSVLGKGNTVNRCLILLLVLVTIPAAVAITLGETGRWRFQQQACDGVYGNPFSNTRYGSDAFRRFLSHFSRNFLMPIMLAVSALLAVGASVYTLWTRNSTIESEGTLHRFPAIHLLVMVLLPTFIYIALLEIMLSVNSSPSEQVFQPTYGQLLALAMAVQPLLQALGLLPRLHQYRVKNGWKAIFYHRMQNVSPWPARVRVAGYGAGVALSELLKGDEWDRKDNEGVEPNTDPFADIEKRESPVEMDFPDFFSEEPRLENPFETEEDCDEEDSEFLPVRRGTIAHLGAEDDTTPVEGPLHWHTL